MNVLVSAALGLQGNCLWGGPRIMKCFWDVVKVAAASRDLNVTHK